MFSKQAVNWEVFEMLRWATRIRIEILENFKNSVVMQFFQDEILDELHSHLTGWRLRLATRILINILEKYHNNSVVI